MMAACTFRTATPVIREGRCLISRTHRNQAPFTKRPAMVQHPTIHRDRTLAHRHIRLSQLEADLAGIGQFIQHRCQTTTGRIPQTTPAAANSRTICYQVADRSRVADHIAGETGTLHQQGDAVIADGARDQNAVTGLDGIRTTIETQQDLAHPGS